MALPGMLTAARTTPVPAMDEQMVTEIKGAVGTAKDVADEVVKKLPVYLSDLLISLVVLIAGLIILRLGRMISLVVLIAGLIILRLGRLIIKKAVRRKGKTEAARNRSETSRSIISSIFSYIMYFVIVFVILTVFGVNVTSILAAAGVVGIAIAFGAQTMVQDILSGLFIWGENSITVGDLITVNDLSGTVEKITIRTTTLRNYNGNIYIIPNGDIRTITNMSRGFKRAIVMIPCPYEENQERIVAMVKEEMMIAAQEIDGIVTVPEVMSIVSFEPNAVTLQIAVPCPVGEHWRIERDIRTRVKARFDREGIIMPHFSAPPMPKE